MVAAAAGVSIEPRIDEMREPDVVGVVDQTIEDCRAGADIEVGEPPAGPAVQ
jgi:hypothetical protein